MRHKEKTARKARLRISRPTWAQGGTRQHGSVASTSKSKKKRRRQKLARLSRKRNRA
jgi:hypothetical protein